MKKKAYFNWSSGKDSAMALYKALKSDLYEILTLFTVINTENESIPMHEISLDLLKKQADCIGIPLKIFSFDFNDPYDKYEFAMQKTINSMKAKGIETALFGDIYLEELRAKRIDDCLKSGIKAEFPVWGLSTKDLLREFVDLGFKSVITCVDGSALDKSFVGRTIDDDFIRDYPSEADVCGENGEYHSFVFDGPIFSRPVDFVLGDVFYKEYQNPDNPETKNKFWYINLT